MSKVPGLTPFAEDSPQAGQRLPAQKPIDTSGGIERMPRLRPTAQAVDLYSRPAPVSKENELTRLADSLGQLNGALNRWGTIGQAARNREAEAAARVATMTRDPQQLAEWQRRNPETVRNIAAGAVLGEDAARRRAEQLAEEYQTSFDRDNGDLEAWLRQKAAEDTEGRDAAYAGSYAQAMAPHFGRLRTLHAQHRAGRETQAIEGGLIGVYQNALTEGRAQGLTPDQIVENIRSRRDQDQRYLRVPFNRQDELLLQAMREHAEKHGDRDLMEGILNAPRTFRHSDGRTQELGALTSRHEYAGQVNTIRDTAQRRERETGQIQSSDRMTGIHERAAHGQLNQADEEYLRSNRDRRVLSEGGYQSILNTNRTNRERVEAIAERDRVRREWRDEYDSQVNQTVLGASEAVRSGQTGALRDRTITTLNARGEPETERWSVKDQLEEASKREQARIDQQLRDRQITPEEALNQQAAWYSRAGTINPVWQRTMQTAYAGANLATLTQNNGRPSPELLAGYELFRQLRAKAPNILDSHVSSEARQFFEQIDAHREHGGQTPEQAIQSAFAAQAMPAEQRQQRRRDVDGAVQGLRQGGLAGWLGQSLSNPQDPYVIKQITEAAQFFGRTLPPTEALQAAKKRFMETHRFINGSAVNVNSLSIPPWFEQEAQTYINAYADRDRSDGVERQDIVIQRVGNGETFRLVHRQTLMPLGDANDPTAMPSIFTMRHLTESRQQRMDRANEEGVARANSRNDPWLVITPGTYIGPFGLGRQQSDQQITERRAREIYEERQQRRDAQRRNPQVPAESALPPDMRGPRTPPSTTPGDPMRPVNVIRDYLRSRRGEPSR